MNSSFTTYGKKPLTLNQDIMLQTWGHPAAAGLTIDASTGAIGGIPTFATLASCCGGTG